MNVLEVTKLIKSKEHKKHHAHAQEEDMYGVVDFTDMWVPPGVELLMNMYWKWLISDMKHQIPDPLSLKYRSVEKESLTIELLEASVIEQQGRAQLANSSRRWLSLLRGLSHAMVILIVTMCISANNQN